MAPSGGGVGDLAYSSTTLQACPRPMRTCLAIHQTPCPLAASDGQKSMAGCMGDAYPWVMLPEVASVLNDPELSEVIWPTLTGIPEIDFSKIIPSEKPSSTLQYFSKGKNQPPKAQPPNCISMNLQNMMLEQTPFWPPNLLGQQGVPRRLMSMCHPEQMSLLGRTGVPHSLHQESCPQGLMT